MGLRVAPTLSGQVGRPALEGGEHQHATRPGAEFDKVSQGQPRLVWRDEPLEVIEPNDEWALASQELHRCLAPAEQPSQVAGSTAVAEQHCGIGADRHGSVTQSPCLSGAWRPDQHDEAQRVASSDALRRGVAQVGLNLLVQRPTQLWRPTVAIARPSGPSDPQIAPVDLPEPRQRADRWSLV